MSGIKNLIAEAQAAGSVRLFSVRQEFPTEWAKFMNQKPASGDRYELVINLRPEHNPFWSQGLLKKGGVTRVDILARSTMTEAPASLIIYYKVNDQVRADERKQDTLVKVATLNDLLVGKLSGGASGFPVPTKPEAVLKLYFNGIAIADLWIAITWNGIS